VIYINSTGMCKIVSGFIVALLIGLLQAFAQPGARIGIDEDIHLIHLKDSIFIHETWDSVEGWGRFSSNGLVVVRNGKALLIDTPMDNEKTMRLTEYLRDNLNVEVTHLIIGHFHNDCLGGLEYLQSIGVKSIANTLTVDKCHELGLPIPDTPFADSLWVDFNGVKLGCQYFGGGHTFDNIVVWMPESKVLFGGCLVKSFDSRTLGNLGDAVVEQWDGTILRVMESFPELEVVVPGHGRHGGAELLERTLELVVMEKGKW
jgi:metallo-beta-lactamase class B